MSLPSVFPLLISPEPSQRSLVIRVDQTKIISSFVSLEWDTDPQSGSLEGLTVRPSPTPGGWTTPVPGHSGTHLHSDTSPGPKGSQGGSVPIHGVSGPVGVPTKDPGETGNL